MGGKVRALLRKFVALLHLSGKTYESRLVGRFEHLQRAFTFALLGNLNGSCVQCLGKTGCLNIKWCSVEGRRTFGKKENCQLGSKSCRRKRILFYRIEELRTVTYPIRKDIICGRKFAKF